MRHCLPSFVLAGLLSLLALSAHAHEFWLQAEPFTPDAGAKATITLMVGENFDGEMTPFVNERTVTLRHYAAGAVTDLARSLPHRTPLQRLNVTMRSSGTHLLTFDSQPIKIALPADKFHAYLHEEGLDQVILQRKTAGEDATPGRERYQRHVKTLLRVGGTSDSTYALRTGQRFEIIPLSDPYGTLAGSILRFKISFDSKPLQGVLVKGWHRRNGQLLTIKSRSNAAGEVAFTLPYVGDWMVSAVHMIATESVPNADWDSFWTSLTFTLPSAP